MQLYVPRTGPGLASLPCNALPAAAPPQAQCHHQNLGKKILKMSNIVMEGLYGVVECNVVSLVYQLIPVIWLQRENS